MNSKTQLVISRVKNLIISKRHVANGKVKGIFLETGVLKALDLDVGYNCFAIRPVRPSSSTPYSLDLAILSGSRPKKLSAPQEGSRRFPPLNPMFSSA